MSLLLCFVLDTGHQYGMLVCPKQIELKCALKCFFFFFLLLAALFFILVPEAFDFIMTTIGLAARSLLTAHTLYSAMHAYWLKVFGGCENCTVCLQLE